MSRGGRLRLPRSVTPSIASSLPQAPTFALLARESIFWGVISNLAACLSAPPRQVPSWDFASMLRSACLPRQFSIRPLVASALLHVGVIACWVNFPSFPAHPLRATIPAEAPRRERKILWYKKSDFLPPIRAAEPQAPVQRAPKSAVAAPPQKTESRPVQVILSRAPEKNSQQVIIQPEAPRLQLPTEVRLPNIVSWTPAVIPPPPSTTEARRELSQIRIPRLSVLSVPSVSPPRVPPKLDLPQIPAVEAKVSQLPKLPVAAPAPPPVARKPPPTPPDILPRTEPASLPNLVAVGVSPAPPPESGEIAVPVGNRAGEFLSSPGRDSAPAGKDLLPGKTGGRPGSDTAVADIRIPQLSVIGGRPPEIPGPVVANVPGPPPVSFPPASASQPPSPDLKKLLASAIRSPLLPETTRGQRIETGFFGQRRVFTTYINMPNLTSGSGSWVLRFAELEGDGRNSPDEEEISSPIALRKVDPQYVPSAIRDKVEGNVILTAHILRDGSVTDIQVVEGLDPRLDASAVEALTRWQFEPARKQGIPVALDVVVQIPFRLPSF